MADKNAFASFQLGTIVAPSHILLYADRGEPNDAIDPFAIIYKTQEIHAPYWTRGDKPKCQDFSRIGKITNEVIPEYFYATHFESMKEALEQIQYFFSFSETQRIIAVTENQFANPLQNLQIALSRYTDESDKLAVGGKVSPVVLGRQIIELAQRLLRDVSLTVSFFTPDCSVFDKHFNHPFEHAVAEHIRGLKNAIELFSQEVNARNIDRDGFTSMMGGLNVTVGNLLKFAAHHSAIKAKRPKGPNFGFTQAFPMNRTGPV